jgi:stage III sporulation protein AB
MIKLLGSILIITGCGYLGFKISRVYIKRTELFRFLQNGLNLLETEINYSATPLPIALDSVGKKINKICRPLFIRSAAALREKKGIIASEAWAEGVAALSIEVPLTEEEKDFLILFGHGLGGSDKEEQLKNIELAKKQLYLASKTAEEEQAKNQRMWQYMGVCLGAFIALILI